MELPKIGVQLFGKYIIERTLGEGGMGVVFAARHQLLEQRVAVKVVRPEFMAQLDAVARFLNEARAAARIENDHVARVLDVGTLEGGLPYMVLEYLEGADLAQLLRQRGPLPVAEVADYLLEAIEGLAHAHAAGIIHRDLKPSNLFLARRPDGTSRVKVLDFGISKARRPDGAPHGDMTRTNALLGSPLYMSPEQLRDAKNVDHRTDVWALGVIAFQLLTGKTPFNADNAVALFAAISESDPPRLRDLRPDDTIAPTLETAVLRCLKRRPEERFASVTDVGVARSPHGTIRSQNALERAARILPARRLDDENPDSLLAGLSLLPAAPQVPTAPAPPPHAHAPTTSPSAMTQLAGPAQTADPWAKSAARATRKKPGLIYFAIGGALLLGAVGVGVAFNRWRATRSIAVFSPVASAATATYTPAAVLPISVTNEEAMAPLAGASVSSVASTAEQTDAGAPEKPRLPSVVLAKPAPKPATSASTAPPLPARSCSPPYWYDAAGIRHFKPECIP